MNPGCDTEPLNLTLYLIWSALDRCFKMSGYIFNLKASDPLWRLVHTEYKATYEWDDDRNVLYLRGRLGVISCQYRPMLCEYDERGKSSGPWNMCRRFILIGPINPYNRHRVTWLPMSFYYHRLIPALPCTATDIVFWIWSLCVKGLENELANMIICFVISN